MNNISTAENTNLPEVISRLQNLEKEEILQEAAGIWKDRADLPDFEAIRAEWDRAITYDV